MQNKAEQDRNQDATVYLVSFLAPDYRSKADEQGNLDERASDALVWELML
jgi:splicing factor 3B subunit 4